MKIKQLFQKKKKRDRYDLTVKNLDKIIFKLKKQIGNRHLILLVKTKTTKGQFFTSVRYSYDINSHTAIGILEYAKLKIQSEITPKERIMGN